MKNKYNYKQLIILLLIFILSLFTTGCSLSDFSKSDISNAEYEAFEVAVKEYIKETYDADIRVDNIRTALNGDAGHFYQIRCFDETLNHKFLIYLYRDSDYKDDKITIGNEKYSIDTQEYVEIHFRNHFLNEMGEYDKNDYILKCAVDFHGKTPSKEKVEKGIAYCVSPEVTHTYIHIYVITPDNERARAAQIKAEEMMEKYSPYTAVIYYAVRNPYDIIQINESYTEKWYDFSNYIRKADFINTIECRTYKASIGFYDREMVKD